MEPYIVTTETYSKESVQEQWYKNFVERMIEIFGDNMANPEHEPIRFKHQVKIANYILSKKS